MDRSIRKSRLSMLKVFEKVFLERKIELDNNSLVCMNDFFFTFSLWKLTVIERWTSNIKPRLLDVEHRTLNIKRRP
jgi:hypothetical protein